MRTQLKPGPHHPITTRPLGRRVTVKVGGRIVAQSDDALLLHEASYPPAIYISRKDVKMELLERTTHSSYCPYKGDASYYSIPIGGERSENAIWTYESPYDAVSGIKGYLVFSPDRVDSIS